MSTKLYTVKKEDFFVSIICSWIIVFKDYATNRDKITLVQSPSWVRWAPLAQLLPSWNWETTHYSFEQNIWWRHKKRCVGRIWFLPNCLFIGNNLVGLWAILQDRTYIIIIVYTPLSILRGIKDSTKYASHYILALSRSNYWSDKLKNMLYHIIRTSLKRLWWWVFKDTWTKSFEKMTTSKKRPDLWQETFQNEELWQKRKYSK